MKKVFFSLLFCAAVLGSVEVKPKYIFLFIGDGMSIPQRIAADESSRSAYGKPLAINGMTGMAPDGKPLTPEDISL